MEDDRRREVRLPASLLLAPVSRSVPRAIPVAPPAVKWPVREAGRGDNVAYPCIARALLQDVSSVPLTLRRLWPVLGRSDAPLWLAPTREAS
jgi:hypothetical protein